MFAAVFILIENKRYDYIHKTESKKNNFIYTIFCIIIFFINILKIKAA